jgi:hypothetical protein
MGSASRRSSSSGPRCHPSPRTRRVPRDTATRREHDAVDEPFARVLEPGRCQHRDRRVGHPQHELAHARIGRHRSHRRQRDNADHDRECGAGAHLPGGPPSDRDRQHDQHRALREYHRCDVAPAVTDRQRENRREDERGRERSTDAPPHGVKRGRNAERAGRAGSRNRVHGHVFCHPIASLTMPPRGVIGRARSIPERVPGPAREQVGQLREGLGSGLPRGRDSR